MAIFAAGTAKGEFLRYLPKFWKGIKNFQKLLFFS